MLWCVLLLSSVLADYTVLNPDFALLEPKGLRVAYPGQTVLNITLKKFFGIKNKNTYANEQLELFILIL